MNTMMIALLAAFGPTPDAHDVDGSCTRTLVRVRKHYETRYVCATDAAPAKVRIEVKPEDRMPGDDWGYTSVGKQPQKAYFRWVDAPKPGADTDCSTAASKEDCDYGFFNEGKTLVRRSICRRDGKIVMCGTKAGECAVCLK